MKMLESCVRDLGRLISWEADYSMTIYGVSSNVKKLGQKEFRFNIFS